MNYKKITKCRVCGTETISYFSYGLMPLANRLFDTKEDAIHAERFQQKLYRCPTCYLSQLSVVVDPEILYSNYPYRSSVSGTFRNHCRRMAKQIAIEHEMEKGDIIIDIAGNDGAFIHAMMEETPWISPFIVDPSSEAMADAMPNVHTIPKFWNEVTAHSFVKNHGKATLINAQNVVAHVDDIHSFFEGIKLALSHDGIFVMEVPHVMNMLTENYFEPVYHEHLSYMSATALYMIANMHNLSLVHVEKHDIHCGTLRAFFVHADSKKIRGTVHDMLSYEAHVLSEEKLYSNFREETQRCISDIDNKIWENPHKKLIGITASAKGNVLLNMLTSSLILYLIDQAPPKIGKFAPGVGLEIKDLTPENVSDADMAIILASNVKDEMEEKLREAGFKGEVYCP